MKLKTRAVEMAGMTCQPDESQLARNLIDTGAGVAEACSTSILCRDPLCTGVFWRLLREAA